MTKCSFLEASNYIYKTFLPLTELKAQTEEFYARIVFYVQGARDANIIFTVSNRPNFEEDAVYEFGIDAMSTNYWSNRNNSLLAFPFVQ